MLMGMTHEQLRDVIADLNDVLIHLIDAVSFRICQMVDNRCCVYHGHLHFHQGIQQLLYLSSLLATKMLDAFASLGVVLLNAEP